MREATYRTQNPGTTTGLGHEARDRRVPEVPLGRPQGAKGAGTAMGEWSRAPRPAKNTWQVDFEGRDGFGAGNGELWQTHVFPM